MLDHSNNQHCFELIYQEIDKDPNFLPYCDIELNHYIAKLDKFASFEKHYIEGVLTGFIAFYCNDTVNKKAFITLVLIHPEYRGKGISKELIDKTLSSMSNNGFLECSLEVKKDNKKAINLYKSKGFNIESEASTVFFMTKKLR